MSSENSIEDTADGNGNGNQSEASFSPDSSDQDSGVSGLSSSGSLGTSWLCVDDQTKPSQVKIGENYQAVLPDLIRKDSKDEVRRGGKSSGSLLVWSPPPVELPDHEMQNYLKLARKRYNYSAYQALGHLFYHNYKIGEAIKDLGNFMPEPNEWSIDDQKLFEEGFRIYAQDFSKYKQLLPHKPTEKLVQYYYKWKSTKSSRKWKKNNSASIKRKKL